MTRRAITSTEMKMIAIDMIWMDCMVGTTQGDVAMARLSGDWLRPMRISTI
ncbi:hypothetical protein D3C87_2005270 [compost metagenome]